MDAKMKKYMPIKRDNMIINTAPVFEIYIPQDFFAKRLAEQKGPYITALGLLSARAYDEKGNPLTEFESLALPVTLQLSPSSTEVRDIEIVKGKPIQKYKVAKFLKGETMFSAQVVRSADAMSDLFNMLLAGGLPQNMPYDRILTLIEDCSIISGTKTGVTANVCASLVMAMYRNPNNLSETFGQAVGRDPKIDMYSYVAANMREVCARSSVYAAMTFEDMDSMITTSVNSTKQKKDIGSSPLEEIIKL